jgi:glycosyltransferase involved in cell wall biosynthesis
MLAADFTTYVAETIREIRRRYLEGEPRPGYLAGYPIRSDVLGDYFFVLGLLRELEVPEIDGETVESTLRRWLPRIDGQATKSFYSYRLAETLLRYGPFSENPLLEGLGSAVCAELKKAVDATELLAQLQSPGGGPANNYWGVLARCEEARRRLGLLGDESVLESAVVKTRQILFANPYGFFDDSKSGHGRFDSYSADLLLFVEPLWPSLGRAEMTRMLRHHVKLFESIAMENGASVIWGRSTGALSLLLNMEVHSLALREGLASDRGRSLRLVHHSFECWKNDWIEAGLITAHQNRSPFGYRGPHRILQMTLDCLGKLAQTALYLRAAADPPQGEPQEQKETRLFPNMDRYHRFAETGAGVWMFRNNQISFQLAVVATGAADADYLPMPRRPGVLENPVDAPLYVLTPQLRYGEKTECFTSLPSTVEKGADSLRLVQREDSEFGQRFRQVHYRVVDNCVEVEERVRCEQAPDCIAIGLVDAERPLQWEILGAPEPWRIREVDVSGIRSFRSFWSQHKRWRELDLPGQADIKVTYRLCPQPRVLVIPGDHDYLRCIYGSLEPPGLEADFLPQQLDWHPGLAREWSRRYDVLHVGWPEHLFGAEHEECYRDQYREFLDELATQPIRVVWTLHNRLPHHGEEAWTSELYERWARLSAAALHHSHWGRDRILKELPFSKSCRHQIIPHPHYRALMDSQITRAEAERKLDLPAAPIRIGVLGRPQKEKQVELVLEEFAASRNQNLQLLVTAVGPDTPIPSDPRIHTFPRRGMLPRETINQYSAACDLLVSCPCGPRYLTSGMVADAVGKAVGLISNQWPFLREIMGDAGLYFDDRKPGDLCRLFDKLEPEDCLRASRAARELRQNYAPEHCARLLATTIGQLTHF